jgi:hypothetical protein
MCSLIIYQLLRKVFQMTYTIYYGKKEPLKAVGKHQINMLMFAEKYQGWHSYSEDKTTLNALNGLLKRKAIIINDNKQFRINYK